MTNVASGRNAPDPIAMRRISMIGFQECRSRRVHIFTIHEHWSPTGRMASHAKQDAALQLTFTSSIVSWSQPSFLHVRLGPTVKGFQPGT